jgi:hypothetical protein
MMTYARFSLDADWRFVQNANDDKPSAVIFFGEPAADDSCLLQFATERNKSVIGCDIRGVKPELPRLMKNELPDLVLFTGEALETKAQFRLLMVALVGGANVVTRIHALDIQAVKHRLDKMAAEVPDDARSGYEQQISSWLGLDQEVKG